MSVTALTSPQQTAVDVLVNSNRLRQVPVDETKAQAFLSNAKAALADVPNVTQAQNAYDLAYNAAHDVGEAMLAAYGYRTKGAGAHETVGMFLEAIFDSPPENAAAGHYDTMRRDRNDLRYQARQPSQAAITAAEQAATVLHTAGAGRLS